LELANALFFGAGFDLALVNESLSSFANLSLELVDIDQDLLEKSVQIMIEKQIAIYDCLFLALAKKERCCLITADRKHHLRQVYSRVSYL
jgi:predicted nucleic acid-binding protein